jgi:hypothetical protein
MRETDKTREFMRRYAANFADKGVVIVAYVLTEDEWVAEFGRLFYKNYASFRAAKTYFLKSNKMPTTKCV